MKREILAVFFVPRRMCFVIFFFCKTLLFSCFRRSRMMGSVFSVIIQKHKVFYSVIIPYVVYVMNYFLSCKKSSKMIFHDKTRSLNISVSIAKRMKRAIQQYISLVFYNTLETLMVFSGLKATFVGFYKALATFAPRDMSFLKLCFGRTILSFKRNVVTFLRTIFLFANGVFRNVKYLLAKQAGNVHAGFFRFTEAFPRTINFIRMFFINKTFFTNRASFHNFNSSLIKFSIISITFLLLFVNPCQAASKWRNGDGTDTILGTANAADIDTLSFQNIVDPLDRLLSDYQRNASLAYASASTLTINIGEVVCSNASGGIRRMRAITTAITLTWANIDTGAEENATYYVYAVADADAATFTGLISKSATTPTGATYYKRLGSFENVAGDITIASITNDNNTYALRLGDWVSKTQTTVYQATTDGYVTAYSSAVSGTTILYTDSSNPPATIRSRDNSQDANFHNVSCKIKRGDYYQVTCDGTATIYWIPNE